VADFVKAAAEQFGFAPDRPESELAFKRAYARAAQQVRDVTRTELEELDGLSSEGLDADE